MTQTKKMSLIDVELHDLFKELIQSLYTSGEYIEIPELLVHRNTRKLVLVRV